METIIDIIGVIGAVAVLIAFFMNQVKRWQVKDRSYLLTNLIGSGLLAIYAVFIVSVPFALINSAWVVFTFLAIINNKRR